VALFDKPVIKYFRASAEEVMANEHVRLEWEVDGARGVKLDVMDVNSAGHHDFFIVRERTFELTASVILQKTFSQVTVRLRKPSIVFFETYGTIVTEGVPLEVHFRVRQALHWQLIAEYTASAGGKREIIAEGATGEGHDLEHQVRVLFKGACTLRLLAENGFEKCVEMRRLGVRQLSVSFTVDDYIVKTGSVVRIGWKAENANRLVFNPGNIDVTDFGYYNFVAHGTSEIHLELSAEGDYGQKAIDTETLYIAGVNFFRASNNEDVSNPNFFLNWKTTGLSELTLQPQDVAVPDNASKYRVEASLQRQVMALRGRTGQGEDVTAEICMEVCTIERFVLRTGKAITGTLATIEWEATNARFIQLKFSDSNAEEPVQSSQTSYTFQVFKDRHRVKLFAWGDTNLAEREIPIPLFESPEIKSLLVPTIGLHLGITWKNFPSAGLVRQTRDLTVVTSRLNRKSRRLVQFLAHLAVWPSSILLASDKLTWRRKLSKWMYDGIYSIARRIAENCDATNKTTK
jgi:hypothetical protein